MVLQISDKCEKDGGVVRLGDLAGDWNPSGNP